MEGIASVIPLFYAIGNSVGFPITFGKRKDGKRGMIELLAPAGSYESFLGAIYAGADAVYAGGEKFGARAYAQNFREEELLAAIDEAHIYGKKLYLTVNTLLKNQEMEKLLYEYLAPFYERGLDGVIVQDLGVLRFIRRNFPGLPLHASTQMTVTGIHSVKLLEEEGASRVVPARELSLKELKAIHRASPLELEVFIHGALCYCYSGQCLFSSILGGRSGNRGRCAQPCRLPYQPSRDGKTYKKSTHLLSPKDLCALKLLPEIIQAGCSSFKIEGRMKQAAYTSGVVSVYRKYLDRYLELERQFQGKPDQEELIKAAYQTEEEDERLLQELFSRGGFNQGYYKQHNGPWMMAFENEKKTTRETFEIRKKQEKIKGNLILFSESPAILEVSFGKNQVTLTDGLVQKAQKQPVTRERILEQMNKLGNTPFCFEEFHLEMDENIFIPMKVLSRMRREALEQLQEQILSSYRRILPVREEHQKLSGNQSVPKTRVSSLPLYASCETREQFAACLKCRELAGIYGPLSCIEEALEKGVHNEKELYLLLPRIVRGEIPTEILIRMEKALEKGAKGFYVSSLEAFGALRERGWSSYCVMDPSLYTWNREAQVFLGEKSVLRDGVPLELNYKELLHRDNHSSELMIYGYLPLMVSAQCVRKNLYRCTREGGRVYMKDRKGKQFPVVCVCDPWQNGENQMCYNVIYNHLPYGLLAEWKQAENLQPASLRMAFTVENQAEVKKVLKDFTGTYKYETEPPARDFTKGHFKREVE